MHVQPAASTAFGSVQCPLHDLALMEVCSNRRLEFIKNGILAPGRRLRAGIRGDCLSLDMCAQIIFDLRHIEMQAAGAMPDIQIARPFVVVANNDLIDYVFDWCAEHDRDDFPITLSGLRDECKCNFPAFLSHLQRCIRFSRTGMMMMPMFQMGNVTPTGSRTSSPLSFLRWARTRSAS